MKVIIQNIAVEYQDEGLGPILLMLHGWQVNSQSFNGIAQELVAGGKRVIRLDLPGFGASELPPEPWNIDDYVQFVSDFIAKLGIRPDALVGHSFGGRIIIKGVASNQLAAQKIILVGSAGIAKQKSLRSVALALAAKTGNTMLSVPPLNKHKDTLRSQLYSKIGSDYYTAGALKDTFVKVVKEDLTSSAIRIKLPTLLIWGENDTQTPLGDGKRLAAMIKGSILKVIPGTTHFVHQEKPHEVASLINEFV